MKKLLIPVILIFLVTLFIVVPFKSDLKSNKSLNKDVGTETIPSEESKAGVPNPASKYCEENGGVLEIITNKDGSQFGMCKFEDYSCEEWVYFNGECTVDGDAEKIKQVLIAKGLDLTGMEVIIHNHLGKYIAGGVVPVSRLGGGGYVFAVKEGDNIKVLADGNGVITCASFIDYPEYPSYLVPECIDGEGSQVIR